MQGPRVNAGDAAVKRNTGEKAARVAHFEAPKTRMGERLASLRAFSCLSWNDGRMSWALHLAPPAVRHRRDADESSTTTVAFRAQGCCERPHTDPPPHSTRRVADTDSENFVRSPGEESTDAVEDRVEAARTGGVHERCCFPVVAADTPYLAKVGCHSETWFAEMAGVERQGRVVNAVIEILLQRRQLQVNSSNRQRTGRRTARCVCRSRRKIVVKVGRPGRWLMAAETAVRWRTRCCRCRRESSARTRPRYSSRSEPCVRRVRDPASDSVYHIALATISMAWAPGTVTTKLSSMAASASIRTFDIAYRDGAGIVSLFSCGYPS